MERERASRARSGALRNVCKAGLERRHQEKLAALARGAHKTGRPATEIATTVHNHRLKNAFSSAAKNTTLHNPDSHLTAYYHSLLDRGLSMTETCERVGRALVRRVCRELRALAQPHFESNRSLPRKRRRTSRQPVLRTWRQTTPQAT